jgi:miniconductance mechanosensitive channel
MTSSLEALRSGIKQSALAWLEVHAPGFSTVVFHGLVLLWIFLFALALNIVLHVVLLPMLVRFAKRRWQRSLLTADLLRRLSYVLQGVVVQTQAVFWLDQSPSLLRLVEAVTHQWILLFSLLSLFSILDAFQSVVHRRVVPIQFPLRGLIQSIKLVASVLFVLLAISILMGKSPIILFSGLGALSAVLLLVFKDPILGLVAGIQLSTNNMLSVGDWLEMPKYGADGDVMDIALTTVKVQNWDKTITTIPTYALISDSFKNWRGMSDAGGRRIKRSVLLEISGIRFLDVEMLERLKKSNLLSSYLEEKMKKIAHANGDKLEETPISLNARKLTNVGTFRAYLVSYLKAHPGIHSDLGLIVRQLEPTGEGLPIQIYAFTNTTDWNEYEAIQSDIFDHVLAILPEFRLRAHEAPTGHDVRALVAESK